MDPAGIEPAFPRHACISRAVIQAAHQIRALREKGMGRFKQLP